MNAPGQKKGKPRTPRDTGQRHGGTMLEKGLTPVQEAYCRARAMGMNMREALTACGSPVTEQTAYTWERRSLAIQNRIQQLSAMATHNAIIKTGLDREWIITRLMRVVERCMQAEEVLDKQGNPIGEFQFDASGANAALRMLGDTMGLFKPADKKPGDEFSTLSDEDIARIASDLAEQTGLLTPAALTHNQAITIDAK